MQERGRYGACNEEVCAVIAYVIIRYEERGREREGGEGEGERGEGVRYELLCKEGRGGMRSDKKDR